MANLFNRVKPTIIFCTIFGQGIPYSNTKKSSWVYWLLLITNIAISSYTSLNILTKTQKVLTVMKLINTINFFIKILTPIISIISIYLNRKNIYNIIKSLDNLLPCITKISLVSYCWTFYLWALLTVAVPYINFFAVLITAKFGIHTIAGFIITFLHNIWHSIPIAQYIVTILLIHHGVRTINEEIMTITQWKSYQTRWKELKNLAEYITTSVFGLVILLFIWSSMGDVLFFFLITLQSFKANNHFHAFVFILMSISRSGFVVLLFRICHNCKNEIIKTIIILNDIKTNSVSDLKAVEYASLYMLHTGCNLKPCNFFELSLSQLLTVFTVLAIFLAFQIQMRLLDSKELIVVDF